METDLLGVVFDGWKKKENPYLLSIIQEYSKTEGQPCADGDITIWITKPAPNPIDKLLAIKEASKVEKEAEMEILNHLYANANGLTWFHNACEGWATAPGNEGKTDTSCVLVGNVLGAPYRRDGFLIGFMLVGPHNNYPSHAHAAHEAYHVIAGEAWLCKNDSGPMHCQAGDVVVHEPYDKHSMVTKESSVLVCWVNSGDTFGEYYFV